MLAILGVISLTGGTCLACGATNSRFEEQTDVLSGLLLVAGLTMIGMMITLKHGPLY